MKIIFLIIIPILLISFVAFDPFPDAFSEPTLHVNSLVVETYVPNLCCMITTMISSLSILNYVDMNSEASVLGYRISLIILNLVMYFVSPVLIFVGIRKKL